ncbi:MAG: Calx-beta domain-containing protein, partial [Dolichospermum sp.]
SLNQSANINNSGIYEFQAGEISNAPNSVGVFNNSGTFRKTNSSLGIVALPFYNTGTIESLMGTVSFYNSYTHNNANLILKGGNFNFINPLTINGGNIEGNGNINAAITNSGLINPRYASNTEFGRLTINGNYTETNNATINIQLGGNTAGTNFDQVDINGTATFDGTLNVSLLNNFTPTLGSTFDVLTYENFTGSLDFTGLKIADNLTLIVGNATDDTQVTLAVSPTSVTEDSTPNLIYTFTRTGSTTNTLTVNYTIGGTATNGSDYSNIGTSVTFDAGSSTATVTVDPTTDTTVENDETAILTLVSGTGYTIGTTSEVTGTITNDDPFTGTPIADTLTGTNGSDTLIGRAGNDTYTVNHVGDIVTEALTAGTDLVNASISYTLTNHVENLTLTGTTAINGTGNAGNNKSRSKVIQ